MAPDAGTGRTTTALQEDAIQTFTAGIRSPVLRPDSEGYEVARHVWNGMIDRHPALIVQCTGTADVMAAVQFARQHGLPVSVRGGGHNVAGNAVCDDGLTIDLSRMKGIQVDPGRRTARAQPGVTWGEFDHETQPFGLATTGGLVSTTGIAGFTLGGGIGWLVRAFGTTCDNLLSADVVSADGRLLHASEAENSDLLWGLRGGGGNFGIVTSFEYRLHPVDTVLGGLVAYPMARAAEVLRFYRDYAPTLPNSITTLVNALTAPAAPFVPQHLQGTPIIAVALCATGPREQAEAALRPLREFGPPALDLIGPMPYTALQSMFDASSPPGLQNYWKAGYLSELSDEVIDTLVSHAGAAKSPLAQTHIHQMGGAVTSVDPNATAFAHRDSPYLLNIVATWDNPQESDQHIRWAREFYAAVQPYMPGSTYVNFMGAEGQDQVRAAYGPNYDRLVALKRKYDPTNFFHFNQNIVPGR